MHHSNPAAKNATLEENRLNKFKVWAEDKTKEPYWPDQRLGWIITISTLGAPGQIDSSTTHFLSIVYILCYLP